jgi:rod shape-determining protein MreC
LLNPRRIRILWIWIALLFIAFILVSSSFGKRRVWGPVEQAVIEITAPVQKVIFSTVDTVQGFWWKYFSLVDIRIENTSLKKEIDALKMENSLYRELVAANRRLETMLQFKEVIHWDALVAQVIGQDPTGWFESVMIDKGKNAGLRLNMAVVNAQGAVGQLVSLAPNYAKVLLVIDQNSAVDCLIQRSREKGIVKGLSSKVCKMHYVVKNGDVAVGDLVVTSGMGRVYPKGIPVGRVVEVADDPWEMFKDVKVEPLVDFSKLEEVLVLLKEDPLSNPYRFKE